MKAKLVKLFSNKKGRFLFLESDEKDPAVKLSRTVIILISILLILGISIGAAKNLLEGNVEEGLKFLLFAFIFLCVLKMLITGITGKRTEEKKDNILR